LHYSNMTVRSAAASIRSYNLYGESAGLPDMVHCETISARSKLHNWELAPHRHARLHQLLFIASGGGHALLDAERYRLSPGRFVNAPAGCVHAFSFEAATEGVVLTIATEVLDETLRGGEGLRPLMARPAVLSAPRGFGALMRLVLEEHDARRFARAHLLRAICAQLAGLAARAIESQLGGPSTGGGASLLRRFESLLELHFREHWSVSRYAAELEIAPGHLGRICRAGAGLATSGVIEARIIREARRLLAFTGLGVGQIAFELGFEDPAYFTRVFVRANGVSPRAFRARLGEASQ